MDGSLGLSFTCPVCGQAFDEIFDFADSPARVIACMPCQTRFRVHLDATVTPLNRDIPTFQATPTVPPPNQY